MGALAKRAHTIGLIRVLRRVRLVKPKRRIPRQRQPDLIRAEYFKALLPFVQVAAQALEQVLPEIRRAFEFAQRAEGTWKQDESHRDYLRRLIEQAGAKAAELFRPTELENVAKRFGERTSDFGRSELNRQAVAAIGVPLSAIEKPITDKLEGFAAENVDLIKSVHERYFERIERDVMRALENGTRPDDLAEQLQDDYGIAENDAMRIARDQIGKLNAELNEERVKDMGITEYIWRTAQDNRVRDEHAHLEGERFSYDDPPNAGTDGESANPGEAIQCRCFAEPAFDQVTGDE